METGWSPITWLVAERSSRADSREESSLVWPESPVFRQSKRSPVSLLHGWRARRRKGSFQFSRQWLPYGAERLMNGGPSTCDRIGNPDAIFRRAESNRRHVQLGHHLAPMRRLGHSGRPYWRFRRPLPALPDVIVTSPLGGVRCSSQQAYDSWALCVRRPEPSASTEQPRRRGLKGLAAHIGDESPRYTISR